MCINTLMPYILLFLLCIVYCFSKCDFYFYFAVKHIGQPWVVINGAI